MLMESLSELYTDESPGLKVDPVIVLVLSLGFIFSVVALHGTLYTPIYISNYRLIRLLQSLLSLHANSRHKWRLTGV
jgi:hypothetical protein